jgi:hypothetical protein
MTDSTTPNIRRLDYGDHLGIATSRISEQPDGQWGVRSDTHGTGSLETLIETGPTAEAAAGRMIAALERAGAYIPEPRDDFQRPRRLDGQA